MFAVRRPERHEPHSQSRMPNALRRPFHIIGQKEPGQAQRVLKDFRSLRDFVVAHESVSDFAEVAGILTVWRLFGSRVTDAEIAVFAAMLLQPSIERHCLSFEE